MFLDVWGCVLQLWTFKSEEGFEEAPIMELEFLWLFVPKLLITLHLDSCTVCLRVLNRPLSIVWYFYSLHCVLDEWVNRPLDKNFLEICVTWDHVVGNLWEYRLLFIVFCLWTICCGFILMTTYELFVTPARAPFLLYSGWVFMIGTLKVHNWVKAIIT